MKTGQAKKFAISLGGEHVFYDRVAVKARTVSARLKRDGQHRESLGRRIRKSDPVMRFSRGSKSLLNGKILRREGWCYPGIIEYIEYLEHEARKI